MTSSKKTIQYIKDNTNKENYVTMFVAGSIPQELIKGSDLDIFFIVKEEKKNEFFENITNIMNKYLKNKQDIKYTFFRGPIKYKNKGLIHFVIYLKSKKPDFEDRAQFIGESRPVLKSLLAKHEIINGERIEQLLKNVDFSNTNITKKDISKMRTKHERLIKEDKICYSEWKKTKNGWQFIRTNKKVSKYLKNYLNNYYTKHINNALKKLKK